jgi:hypothetical protein
MRTHFWYGVETMRKELEILLFQGTIKTLVPTSFEFTSHGYLAPVYSACLMLPIMRGILFIVKHPFPQRSSCHGAQVSPHRVKYRER